MAKKYLLKLGELYFTDKSHGMGALTKIAMNAQKHDSHGEAEQHLEQIRGEDPHRDLDAVIVEEREFSA